MLRNSKEGRFGGGSEWLTASEHVGGMLRGMRRGTDL